MDRTEFREAVESAKATQLDRLGSSKLLIALTGAELDREPVLAAAADSEHAARRTFEAWIDDEDDDGARETFAATADQEREHFERVAAHLPEAYDPADGGPMHAYLRGREDTIERIAGGLVGRTLVSLRAHTQVIGFFVNDPDAELADLFRELKTDTADSLDTGLDLLADRCGSEEEWAAARSTAEYTIQVAYDDYADALTEMGVNPKTVC